MVLGREGLGRSKANTITALTGHVSKHDAHMMPEAPRNSPGEARRKETMLSLCLLALAVIVVTLVTPVAVPIMWRYIEAPVLARPGGKGKKTK
jgi:hypothetical protein